MNTKESSKRQPILDYIKCICIIFVIINHSDVISTSDPLYLFFIRMAVPVFILISGYTFALSNNAKTISKMYTPTDIGRKFFRYTIPAVITYSIYILLLIISGRSPSIQSCVTIFFLGLYGLGAYYYGILIQFIFICPIIYIIVKKWDVLGVTLVAFINFFYELFFKVNCDNTSIYRILIFKYLFFISLGIYLYIHRNDKINPYHLVQMICIGIVYLILPTHFGYSYQIFCNWSDTSMIVGFYTFPVLYFIITNTQNSIIPGILGKLLSNVGKASYHIMFTQMLFFTVRNTFYKFFNISQLGVITEVIFAVMCSVILGIIFYKLDNRIFKNLYFSR